MKRISFLAALPALLLALAGCGGSDDPKPTVKVDELAAGRYVVSLGDAGAPTIGKYYAASDGSRLLVVADASDRGQALYRRSGNGGWAAVPPVATDVSVTLLRSDALPATAAPDLPALAGSYVTQAAGTAAVFNIDAAGTIRAGSSSCKLSGQLAAGALPGTLKLQLATSGCGTLPASATGVATLDGDYAPARLRLLADDGKQPVDLWAYAE